MGKSRELGMSRRRVKTEGKDKNEGNCLKLENVR